MGKFYHRTLERSLPQSSLHLQAAIYYKNMNSQHVRVFRSALCQAGGQYKGQRILRRERNSQIANASINTQERTKTERHF